MNYYGSRLERQFVRIFKSAPDYAIDTGGRYEICGNHTDHNHGLCLVANASLRIKAYLKKNETKVRIKSAGYSYFEFDVSDIEFDKNELNKTLLLAKGVLFRLKELGYKIGGFDATIESKIPDGSGVSSSAAIESLFGYIISYLYNDGKIPQIDIAKTGKFSENVYFGKPSGLLDQVGTSFDSFNYIDFKDVENPIIQTLIATTFTWLVTALGATSVFLFRKPNQKALNLIMGFASGVMLAASFYSLLVPSIDIGIELEMISWLWPSIGFFAGGIFVILSDILLDKVMQKRGKQDNGKRKNILLVGAITFHNIPEGAIIGVAFGSLALGIESAGIIAIKNGEMQSCLMRM